jgi:hypothetical protein
VLQGFVQKSATAKLWKVYCVVSASGMTHTFINPCAAVTPKLQL